MVFCQRSLQRNLELALLALVLAPLNCGIAAEEGEQPARPPAELNFAVTKTFDGKEFACEMKLAGQGYGRFRPKLRQRKQSRASTAAQHQRNYVAHRASQEIRQDPSRTSYRPEKRG